MAVRPALVQDRSVPDCGGRVHLDLHAGADVAGSVPGGLLPRVAHPQRAEHLAGHCDSVADGFAHQRASLQRTRLVRLRAQRTQLHGLQVHRRRVFLVEHFPHLDVRQFLSAAAAADFRTLPADADATVENQLNAVERVAQGQTTCHTLGDCGRRLLRHPLASHPNHSASEESSAV